MNTPTVVISYVDGHEGHIEALKVKILGPFPSRSDAKDTVLKDVKQEVKRYMNLLLLRRAQMVYSTQTDFQNNKMALDLIQGDIDRIDKALAYDKWTSEFLATGSTRIHLDGVTYDPPTVFVVRNIHPSSWAYLNDYD